MALYDTVINSLHRTKQLSQTRLGVIVSILLVCDSMKTTGKVLFIMIYKHKSDICTSSSHCYLFVLFFFFSSIVFLPHYLCQTVVNFISELQEQMCQFQKEINSKIQEKKALKMPADRELPMACSTESTEVQGSNLGMCCDRTSGGIPKLEEASDGPDGNTHSPRESSSDAEKRCHCRGDSVGNACLHGF